jgi:hypothetical protein
MPAKSEKQERFMQAVANNPKFAKKVGVPQSVGREFTKKEGSKMPNTKRMNLLEQLGRVDSEKARTPKGKANLMAEKKRVVGEVKKMKSGGMAKMTKSEMASKMGTVKTAKPSMGSASKRADGVAMKGKTKGMMPKMMRKGGRAC